MPRTLEREQRTVAPEVSRPSEREIVGLWSSGLSREAIADQLDASLSEVETILLSRLFDFD
jgi:DNA-binding CsgD family transcriptional regulator